MEIIKMKKNEKKAVNIFFYKQFCLYLLYNN